MFVETFLGLCNHPLGGQPDHRGGPQTLRPASGKTYCCGPIEEQVSSARGGCLPLGEELGFLLARGLLFLPLLKGLLGIEAAVGSWSCSAESMFLWYVELDSFSMSTLLAWLPSVMPTSSRAWGVWGGGPCGRYDGDHGALTSSMM